jgi:uncharacterized protein (DUF305 family)
MRIIRTTARLVLTLSLSLGLLAACADDEPHRETDASASDHNSSDVAFATDMVQHHAQALAMVQLTVDRELDPAVLAVVESIRAAQTPEIETMVDWLVAWDEPIPATVNDHVNADDHMEGDDGMGDMDGTDGDSDTGTGMPGMMSSQEMDALAQAPDDEFQDLWLEMMIEHHDGAVSMAQDEQEQGKYAPARELAASIETSQVAEIATMEQLVAEPAS